MRVHSLYTTCLISQRALLYGRFTGLAGLCCWYEQHVGEVVCGAWRNGSEGLGRRKTSQIIWPLRIDQLFGYCASTNYLATAHRPIILLLRIDHLFGYCASTIWLLRVTQLFGYCASTNYLATAHRPIIWPLCIAQLFGHCASTSYLATAHRPTIGPLRIDQLFSHCASPNYWATAHRPVIWPLRTDQSFGHCASTSYLATAHGPTIWPLRIALLLYSVSCDGLCYQRSGYYSWNNELMLAFLTVMLFQIMQRYLRTLYQLVNTILSASTHWYCGC